MRSLTMAGYAPVEVFVAKPNENETDNGHMHPFDVRIVVVEGEMEFEVEEEKKLLRSGDSLDIPAYALHNATTGPHGCTYVEG